MDGPPTGVILLRVHSDPRLCIYPIELTPDQTLRMNVQRRFLIVGRQQESVDYVVRVLERSGCIVTTTLSDGVAIDLAGTSDYDALLIEADVPQSDSRFVATEARSKKPWMPVITVHGPEFVVSQLRQAGISL